MSRDQTLEDVKTLRAGLAHHPEPAVLTDEEEQMLLAFRRFKLANGGPHPAGVFHWNTVSDRMTVGPFTAADWARSFVAYIRDNPARFTDHTMTAWFSEAIMRGYDERGQQHKTDVAAAGCDRVQALAREAITGAVARGWAADGNRHKEMDCELAEAIVAEILKLA